MRIILLLLILLLFISPGSAQSVHVLDFLLIDNRPFVRGEVNGVSGYFIVDTGGRIVLDKTFAREAEVAMSDSMMISGAGNGQQWGWFGPAINLDLGGPQIGTDRVVIVDLGMIRDSLRLPFLDGIVGVELFRKYRVKIDYHSWEMTLTDYSQAVPVSGTGIPFTFYRNQIPMIRLENPLPGEFILDTGDRFTLTLFDVPDTLNSELKVTGYGVGGPIIASTFVIDAFGLPDVQPFMVMARTPQHNEGGWAHTDVTGSIGSGLLRQFRIIFDYQKQKIWITPLPRPEITEFVYHTANPAPLAEWYTTDLPFSVNDSSGQEIILTHDRARIRLVKNTDALPLGKFQSEVGRMVPAGVFKIGFSVPDAEALHQRLREQQPDERAPGRLLTFYGRKMFLQKDPEGNMLQFFEGPGDYEWENSFLALITNKEEEYDQWMKALEEEGFREVSNFNQVDDTRQQNFRLGNLSVELLLLRDRVSEQAPSVSGVQEKEFWQALNPGDGPN